MSPIYDLFRRAILERKQVAFDYKGHRRIACPHVIGWKKGLEKVLTFQFAGGSSTGLPPGGEWRCLFLSDAGNVELVDGEWHTGMSHTQPQTCVDDVDVQVSVTSPSTPYSRIA
jgi:hypothetical protein